MYFKHDENAQYIKAKYSLEIHRLFHERKRVLRVDFSKNLLSWNLGGVNRSSRSHFFLIYHAKIG
jgi:hypothetical protein